MQFQRIVEGDEELWRKALLAELARGFELSGLDLENMYLLISDRDHRSKSTPTRPQGQDLAGEERLPACSGRFQASICRAARGVEKEFHRRRAVVIL